MKIFFALFFACNMLSASAQNNDAGKTFLATKGTWEFPLGHIYQHVSHNTNIVYHYPDMVSFASETQREVKAVTNSEVVKVVKVDDIYVVISRMGNYFLTYAGFETTQLKRGDTIHKGSIVGLAEKNKYAGDIYTIDIYLNENGNDISPLPWFNPFNFEKSFVKL